MDDLERTLLTKGVDLFADWVRSRWRRRAPSGADDDAAPTQSPAREPRGLDSADRDALLANISETLLDQHQSELRAVIERLEIHHANLQHLQAQRARWGEALVPPIIVNSIRDEETAVDEHAQRLAELLQAISQRPLPETLRLPALDDSDPPPGLPSAE